MKYKVGDRVRFIKNYDPDHEYDDLLQKTGEIERIVQYSGYGLYRYELTLDGARGRELVFKAVELEIVEPLNPLEEHLYSL